MHETFCVWSWVTEVSSKTVEFANGAFKKKKHNLIHFLAWKNNVTSL